MRSIWIQGPILSDTPAKVGRASTGNIVVGGIITPITLALGYDLHELEEATGSNRIDLESCIAFCMIVCRVDCYCLVLKDQDSHLLPDPPHTMIHERSN